jgi:hypothetical protein
MVNVSNVETMAKARLPLPTALIEEYLELRDGGVLVWRKSPHPRIAVGERAGRSPKGRHLQVMLKGRSYGYHRIVYYLAYGVDSLGWEIDHINRNPEDNRPENLRLAQEWQNKWNTTSRDNTNVGHRGIRKRFWGLNYKFEVSFRGRYVGSYSSLQEAVEAWEARAREYAKEFFCQSPQRPVG